MAALAAPPIMSDSPEDTLQPEDRWVEQSLRKAHQATAWAVKASTAASFFNRVLFIWLRQLQDRIPATDVLSHQNLNKLSDAMEFSADTTLNVARFASKTIASTMASRQLLWFRQWQADAKHKWRLAFAPFSEQLFGDSLGPILVESWDKCKVLPSPSQQADFCPQPYFRRQSFRETQIVGLGCREHSAPLCKCRTSSRTGQGGISSFPLNSPFEGGASCSFRRQK